MSTLPTLDEVLAGLPLPDPLDRDWVMDQLLPALGVSENTFVARTFEDLMVNGHSVRSTELGVRPGGWTINVAGSAAKTLLAGALVAAGLAAAGKDDIPAELIPAVLPLIVDLAKVRLDRRDSALLLPLRLATSELANAPIHPQVVYDRLETSVRAQLNYGDFLAFCDQLIAAGELDDGDYGDVKPRTAGPAWVRVTFI